jgi:glycosyltransferase involved in cell wall biosynthesis
MRAPFFSVIIPTYNRAPLLKEALDSVFAQEFTDYEVIVVDDGSTDGTLEMLRGYGSRIQVLTQRNSGPGAARNLGSVIAKGEYLAFLDSDDVFFERSLEVYKHIIIKSGNPSFVVGKPFIFSESPPPTPSRNVGVNYLLFEDYLASGDEWRWWGASSFVVYRKEFENVRGFTQEWVNAEDADLALRLGNSPGFVQITSPYTFGYREHEVSAMKQKHKTIKGSWLQIRCESEGRYPGGRARLYERLRILTGHLRPVSLDCLRSGLRNDAWKLYWKTFFWNFRLYRWKYLLGFPVKAFFS